MLRSSYKKVSIIDGFISGHQHYFRACGLCRYCSQSREQINLDQVKSALLEYVVICERLMCFFPACPLPQADIVFVVDASVARSKLMSMLDVQSNMLDIFHVGDDKVRVGMILFSAKPQVIIISCIILMIKMIVSSSTYQFFSAIIIIIIIVKRLQVQVIHLSVALKIFDSAGKNAPKWNIDLTHSSGYFYICLQKISVDLGQ